MAISNNFNDDVSQDRGETGLSWLDRLAVNLGFSTQTDARSVIEAALKGDDGSAFTAAERTMLQKILHFKELRVEDVMVPRGDIVAVDVDETLAHLLCVFEKAGHSRVPIYRDTLDEPLGMAHVKDLMGWIIKQGKTDASDETFHLGAADLSKKVSEADITREVIFAPPSMSALDLFVRMQTRHIHLALIIDEHGGTDGLVSIEDLLEEVVGDIEDEHDTDDAPLILEDASGLIVDARAEIEDVETKIGVLLSSAADEDVDTLGGLIFTMLGRVPIRGEIVHHPAGVEFEIIDADKRRVKRVRLKPLPDQASGSLQKLEGV